MTVDQRLTRNISFYGEGWYSNRRAQVLQPSSIGGGAQDVLSVAVPTYNPYYPTGGAPNNLRVNYNTSIENPTYVNAYELAQRYQIEGFPTLVVLNGDGKTVWRYDGLYTGDIAAFLAELDKVRKG